MSLVFSVCADCFVYVCFLALSFFDSFLSDLISLLEHARDDLFFFVVSFAIFCSLRSDLILSPKPKAPVVLICGGGDYEHK